MFLCNPTNYRLQGRDFVFIIIGKLFDLSGGLSADVEDTVVVGEVAAVAILLLEVREAALPAGLSEFVLHLTIGFINSYHCQASSFFFLV